MARDELLPKSAGELSARVWGALGVVYVVWGSTYLAIRVAVRTLPPLLSASVRWLVAGSLLYAVSIRRGDREGDRPTIVQWRAAAIVGGALLLGGNGLVVLGEQHISSSIAALLVSSVPLWIAAIGFVVYRERLSLPAVGGLVLGFGGVALLVRPSASHRLDPTGVAAVLAASFVWAAGSLYARNAPLPRRPLVGASMQMLCGAALLAVTGVATGELDRIDVAGFGRSSLLALAYLAVVGSLAGYTAYAWLLKAAPTSIVATYAYVNPVVAVVLGWWLLDERVTVRTLLAGAIIVAAVALIVTARAAPPRGFGNPADAPPPHEG